MNLPSNYRMAVARPVLALVQILCAVLATYFGIVARKEIFAGDTVALVVFWILFSCFAVSLALDNFIRRYLRAYTVRLEPGMLILGMHKIKQAGIVVRGDTEKCLMIFPRGWKFREDPQYGSSAFVLDEKGRLRLTIKFEIWRYTFAVEPRFEFYYIVEDEAVRGVIFDNALGDRIYKTRVSNAEGAMTTDQLRRAIRDEAMKWFALRGINLKQEWRNWRRTFEWQSGTDDQAG